MKIKTILGLLAVFILTVICTASIVRWKYPKIVPVPDYVQVPIDSTTWVRRSTYVEQKTLLNKLKNENESLYKNIKNQKAKIANLTRINGKLNLNVDSLSKPTVALPPKDRDTSYVFTKIYGDSLLKVESKIHIHNDSLTNDLRVDQLRPVKLDVVYLTKGDFQSVLISSKDLSVTYTTDTAAKPIHKHWVRNLGIGFSAGILTTLILLK